LKKILVTLLVVVALCGCSYSMKASFVKTSDSLEVELENATGDYTTVFEIAKGETLKVKTDYEVGTFKLEINNPEGEEIYSGNANRDWEFTLENLETGEYEISIDYHNTTISLEVTKE